jgi:hypothetical protein
MIVQTKFEKIERRMEKGCPQGSIIEPIAWNMCMDDLLNNVSDEFDDKDVEVIAYADDLVTLRTTQGKKLKL